jgi:hypothetical protein
LRDQQDQQEIPLIDYGTKQIKKLAGLAGLTSRARRRNRVAWRSDEREQQLDLPALV